MISPVKLWRNQKNTKDILGKVGKIIAFTIVRVPPEGFEDQAPYPLILVKIDHKNYISQLVDVGLDKIKVGEKVTAIIRRVRQPHPEGIIPYGIKFKIIQ